MRLIFIVFYFSAPDHELWNAHLNSLKDEKKDSYYSSVWLYTECYFYRQIKSIFEQSDAFKDFDYFEEQKENALTNSISAMIVVTEQIDLFNSNVDLRDDREEVGKFFVKLLKVNLWGNRCDLSISAGKECKQSGDPISAVDSLESFILVDNTTKIWECISSGDTDSIIDIVNDNAGYELFTDLCLADFIIEHKLAKTVRFHPKSIPWFISDVNPKDFHWTLKTLSDQTNVNLSGLGKRCTDYLASGQFQLMEPHYFWTTGYTFNRMNEICPDLYNILAVTQLIIFKGDLNYRKLIGEVNWEPSTDFTTALQGFKPNNLCALRTIKADLVAGLVKGKSEELSLSNERWMETGEYGLIQFSSK